MEECSFPRFQSTKLQWQAARPLLRILTFTSLFPNSVDLTHGIFILQRAVHLAKQSENEVRVISPLPYFPSWLHVNRWSESNEVPRREIIAGLEVHHPRYFLLPKVMMPFHALSMYVFSLPCVLELNRHWKIECVDAHFVYPDGLAALLLARYLGVPAVVSARGTDVNEFPKFRTIRPMIRWTLAQTDGVIAVSAALKRAMLELSGDSEKIRIIPNGVDPQRFGPVPPGEARKRLGLAAEGHILLSVGSLIPSKGQGLLIKAVGQIAGRYPGVHLFLLGEGPERRSLQRLVDELGLGDAVHLVGKRPNDELGLWFNAATASCLISTREGWPNVVTESLSCGTPVVASKAGGIPEIVHAPEFGILVDQNLESVSRGLEQALTQRWDRQLIASQNRLRTWDHVAAEVDAFLRTAIDARSLKGGNRRVPIVGKQE